MVSPARAPARAGCSEDREAGNNEGMLEDFWQDPSRRLAALLLAMTLAVDLLLRRLRARMEREEAAGAAAGPASRRAWLTAVVPPLSLGVWFYGVYAVLSVVSDRLSPEWGRAEDWLQRIAGAGAFVALPWLLHRCAGVIEASLVARAGRTGSRMDDVFLPLAGSALRLILPVVALFFLVRLWSLDVANEALVRKLAAVVLILGLSWLAVRAASLLERALVERSGAEALTTVEGRSAVTRVRLLRKVATFLVGVFALAATLMLFDEVRDVGRSLLASAGVAGLIIGFAAQRSIGGIFAGLQIAFTQPIRLGDVARVAGETGVVEEITLTYVALQIWDGRRLIVPINHLIENPVINLTKTGAPHVAVVLVRADFLLPMDEFRAHMAQCVERAARWDKKVFGVDLVDARQDGLEIRVVASAADPGGAFGLGCELREKAINFIRERYPHCLPRARTEQTKESETRRREEKSSAPAPDRIGQERFEVEQWR
jgi:small-conductance mechanosensitive channel